VQLAAINIYPIKSCAGISLASSRVMCTGLEWDRHWMLVRDDGRFVTQRELPMLATIVPRIVPPSLVLSAPGEQPLSIPLSAAGGARSVTVWRDRVGGIDCGDAVAAWLSAVTRESLRLVAFDPALPRASNPVFTGAVTAFTEFSDGYAILLLSETSLEDLNGRLPGQPLEMAQFRPNLVLSDASAYAEDKFSELRIGAVTLRVVKPCTRCKITTIDQRSGIQHGDEPLRTLRGYRYDRQLNGVTFGQNAIVLNGVGQELKVGMAVHTC